MTDDMLRVIELFVNAKRQLKEAEQSVKFYKASFEDAMSNYFSSTLAGNKKRASFVIKGNKINITKVDRTTIVWDEEKLKKRLPKNVRQMVFKKQYSIVDYAGLVKYLKSLGADPNVFKMFVVSEERFDPDEIDRLSDLGYIGVNNIKGCYKVVIGKSYYTVKSEE